jgi:hypothetical protein
MRQSFQFSVSTRHSTPHEFELLWDNTERYHVQVDCLISLGAETDVPPIYVYNK